MSNRCTVPGCRDEVEVIYLDRGVCAEHWNELAEGGSGSRLRMVLGLDLVAPTAMEKAMSKGKTTKKTAATKAATTRVAKPKPEAPKDDLVVFAFRLTQAERDLIHKTAGPARASRFVRRVAAAFAGEDEGAFRSVLKEAREARS